VIARAVEVRDFAEPAIYPPYRPIELGDTLFYELALGSTAGRGPT
jgi:hypothetical protein